MVQHQTKHMNMYSIGREVALFPGVYSHCVMLGGSL